MTWEWMTLGGPWGLVETMAPVAPLRLLVGHMREAVSLGEEAPLLGGTWLGGQPVVC